MLFQSTVWTRRVLVKYTAQPGLYGAPGCGSFRGWYLICAPPRPPDSNSVAVVLPVQSCTSRLIWPQRRGPGSAGWTCGAGSSACLLGSTTGVAGASLTNASMDFAKFRFARSPDSPAPGPAAAKPPPHLPASRWHARCSRAPSRATTGRGSRFIQGWPAASLQPPRRIHAASRRRSRAIDEGRPGAD